MTQVKEKRNAISHWFQVGGGWWGRETTGEQGRAGGTWGSLPHKLCPITSNTPITPGKCYFTFFHPHLLARASFPRCGLSHLCQHSKALRSRARENSLEYLETLTEARRRLGEQGEHESLKWETLDPGTSLLLPCPGPNFLPTLV